MKNVVDGSLFLGDDPSRNVPMISIKKQCIQWYKLKRNKIVVGAISILFCLSLTLLFVAIHLVTYQSSGEKLNILYDLLNIMYVPYTGCVKKMITTTSTSIILTSEAVEAKTLLQLISTSLSF